MDETNYILEANTQLTHAILRIGAGNFWVETYTTAAGVDEEGPTAGLWIYVKDAPEQNQHLRVHAGQIVSVAGYQIRVIAVSEQSVPPAVELSIKP